MDSQTLGLIRILQSGPYDNAAFQQIRQLLPDARSRLAAEGDRETLSDIVELLLEWSNKAEDRAAASLALYEGGELAEQTLGEPERAARMFALSVASNPRSLKALQRAEGLLVSLGQIAQLEAMLSEQARSLAAMQGVEAEIRGPVFRLLGRLKAEHTGDIDGAIDAYEQALDAEADVAVIAALAQLYAGRNRQDDAERAADLYCTLGEVTEGPDGIAYLEQALNLMPGHEQALDALEELVPEAERPARLGGRWTAFVTHAPEGPASDARRRTLAQAFMEEERYNEALQWISPLAARGDAAAASIREGLYRLLGVDPATVRQPEPSAPAQAEPQASPAAPAAAQPPSYPPQAPVAQPPSYPPQAPIAQPPSYPPQAPVAQPPSYPPQAPTSQPAPAPGPAAPVEAQPATAPGSVPPAKSGGTLVGYAVPQDLKEVYGAAMEMKPLAAQPARIAGEPQAVAPAAPTAQTPVQAEPLVQIDAEIMAVKPPVAAEIPAPLPAPAEISPADEAFLSDTDTELKPKSPLVKWLAGGILLALVAGGGFAYQQFFMKTPEPAESAATAGPGESQPGAAGSGAGEAQPGQPAETLEPTAAAETPGGQAEDAEQTEAEQETEQTTPEAEEEEEQRTVRMVSELLRIRGGKIDRDEVMEAAESAFPGMERCYLRILRQKPRLKGRVVLAWTIKTSGKVVRARRAGGTIQNRTFARCLANAVAKTRFPRPRRKSALVRLPFVFQKPQK